MPEATIQAGLKSAAITAAGVAGESSSIEALSWALNKVKITRILDKLEGMGILERKRRGMTNVVILKHKWN